MTTQVDSNACITRRVSVDRTQKGYAAIAASGRTVDLGSVGRLAAINLVARMPEGEGEDVELVFFKPGRDISDNDLAREYESLGLKPADPYSLAAFNTADPTFADERPNATHWRNEGSWCLLAFHRENDERIAHLLAADDLWSDDWWFAGLRA